MNDVIWRMSSYDKAGFATNKVYQAIKPKLSEHLGQIDAKAMRLWFYQMRKVADLTPHLAEITVPVLAIAGKQDILVPPKQAEVIANGVANGTCLLLDGMNHALFVEQPERVYTCVAEWLQTVNPV